MAILGGLKDRDLSCMLIAKRRDIMMESHAYEIIMNEGFEKGMQQGMRQGLLTAIKVGLDLKFGTAGLKVYPEIKKIDDVDMLETLSEAIKQVKDIDAFRSLYASP